MIRSVFPVLALVSAAVYQESSAPTNTKDKDYTARPGVPPGAGVEADRVESEVKYRLIWENW